MKLRLAHGPLEAEQQPVVEVCRVVDTVLVEDQGVAQRADLEQPVPVRGVACQPRDLEPQDDARASHPDLGHELLKALTIYRRSARPAEIGIDDDDAFVRPAECDGPLTECVLALCALRVLDDLPQRRLPHIQVRAASEVAGGDLVVRFVAHEPLSP